MFLLYKSNKCLKTPVMEYFTFKRYSISGIFKNIFLYKSNSLLKMVLFRNILYVKIFPLVECFAYFFCVGSRNVKTYVKIFHGWNVLHISSI